MALGRLRTWAVPALFATLGLLTAVHTGHDVAAAVGHPSARAWLISCYGLLRTGIAMAFAVFTIGRAAPRRPSREPRAWLACVLAMGAVVAFGEPRAHVPVGVVLAGDLVAVAFCTWLLTAVLNLGRCFGVLPEARGLVTGGPYRLVRHPVYLGEIGACSGLAIAAPSWRNAAVLAVLLAAQIIRMGLEEAALSAAFSEYAAYARRTPRLLPRPRVLWGAITPATRPRPGAQAAPGRPAEHGVSLP